MDTKFKWLTLNVLLPTLPLILRGILKIFMGHFDCDTINSAELFFILGLISLLISQDLRLRKVPLDNLDKRKERNDRATTFLVLFIIFVFFSAGSELFHIMVIIEGDTTHLVAYRVMSFLAYFLAFILIKYSCRTQKEFNLTSKFI